MFGDEFTCPVCFLTYDTIEIIPKLIFGCGHTLCSKCIRHILESKDPKKCPLDDIPFGEKQTSIETFPVNFTLSQLIEEKSKLEVCSKHKSKLRFVCLTDRERICDDCAYIDGHVGHKLLLISKVKIEAKEKGDKLNTALDCIVKHQKTINGSLEQHKTLVRKSVKEKIQEMQMIFSCKEFEISSMLSHAIDSEKEKMNKKIGKDSELANRLRKRIEDYGNLKNTADILDEEDPLNDLNTDEIFDFYLQETNKKIKEASECLNDAFDGEKNYILEQYLPVSQLIDRYDTQLDEENIMKAEDTPRKTSDSFQFASEFDVRIKGTCLTMSINSTKSTVLNLQDLRAVQRVELILGRYELINDHIKVLLFIWEHIVNVSSLQVIFNPEGLTDGCLIQFLPTIFNRSKDIEDVEVWLEGCPVGDESMNFLFTQIMNRMTNLKHIRLVLDNSGITDASLTVFAQNVLPAVKGLETLKLELYNLAIYNKGVTELFQNIGNLKELQLHLHGTGISDNTIEVFTDKGLPSINGLDKLSLWLGSTKVTDRSIAKLLAGLRDVKALKELKLNLRSTEISDGSVCELEKSILGESSPLKHFVIDLNSTKVSEDMVKKIYALQSGFNMRTVEQHAT